MKLKDKDGNYIEVLAMLDSGSNTSFISKNVAKKLGIRGYKTHLTMNLVGGQKKSEESELIDLAVSSTLEQGVQKFMQAYAINKPCSSATTVSRTTLESYPSFKTSHKQFAFIRRNSGLVDWYRFCRTPSMTCT